MKIHSLKTRSDNDVPWSQPSAVKLLTLKVHAPARCQARATCVKHAPARLHPAPQFNRSGEATRDPSNLIIESKQNEPGGRLKDRDKQSSPPRQDRHRRNELNNPQQNHQHHHDVKNEPLEQQYQTHQNKIAITRTITGTIRTGTVVTRGFYSNSRQGPSSTFGQEPKSLWQKCLNAIDANSHSNLILKAKSYGSAAPSINCSRRVGVKLWTQADIVRWAS